jgi:hypothetical protein
VFITPKREEGGATMSAGEAELKEPRITFLATLPEVMRHIERLRIKNIIPGVVKRSHDWLDKDSSGNHGQSWYLKIRERREGKFQNSSTGVECEIWKSRADIQHL